PVHGNVVRLGMDGGDPARRVADADRQRLPAHGGQRPVEEAAAIAQAIIGFIEADHRRDHDIGLDRGALRGHEYVPDAALQPVAWRPDAIFQRPALLDDDGQGDAPPALQDPYGPVAQVGLAPDRPVGADDAAGRLADHLVEMAG